MVKNRMAMRMVTIFVALIVCGMFFPGLARGLSVNTELSVPLGKVELEDEKITSVEITSDEALTIWPALDHPDADCFQDFKCTGCDISSIGPGANVTVQVTFKPLDVGTCSAWLTIMPIGSNPNNVQSVRITFTGEGVEETSDNFGPIVMGGITTSVMDRLIIDEHTNCTLSEMIDECMDKFNGVRLMRSIAWTTGELYSEGLITCQEKNELRRTAAKLTWRRMFQEMKKRRSSKGSTKLRRFWWCRDN